MAQLANPAISGPDASAAGDGNSNFVKYAAGISAWDTLPNIPTFTSPPYLMTGERYWKVQFPRNTWATDLAYLLRYSSQLSGWSDANVVSEQVVSTSNGVETIEATLLCLPGDQGFVVLRVAQSP